MVSYYVYNNLDAELFGFFTHRLKLVFSSQLIVSDSIVGGLEMVIPLTLALAVQAHSAALALEALINRRSLDSAVTRRGYIFKRVFNSFKIPTETM
jgi:hypothetical protein